MPVPPLWRDLTTYWNTPPAQPRQALHRGEVAFATSTGRRMDQAAVFRLVQRVAHLAGIAHADRLSPHSLRHSLATALLRQGAPLHRVKHLLGHLNRSTTVLYAHDRADLDGSPAYTIAKLFTHHD